VNIVLVEPEIPQNTGNVARTCAALGADLHLVHPLGFLVNERSVRRAGLDYWHLLRVHEHPSLDAFLASCGPEDHVILFSSKASVAYHEISYDPHAFLVFGRETAGLPDELLASHRGPVVRIPTVAPARCLNLSNAVAVGAYEAARQNGFTGLQQTREITSPPPASEGPPAKGT
jgi:tRNA (cytidine/uridine-2'-O-)-methyltransferase